MDTPYGDEAKLIANLFNNHPCIIESNNKVPSYGRAKIRKFAAFAPNHNT